MPGKHLFTLGLNQKNFLSTSRVTGPAINMGCTRGRGSTTRMLNYCTQRSANPSLCINQFITVNKEGNAEPYVPPETCVGYQLKSYWASFRGSAYNSFGRSLFDGPISEPTMIKQYESSNFAVSPVIDKNGNIYLPELNPYLYCFDSNLNVKWIFNSNIVNTNTSYLNICIGCDGTVYFTSNEDNVSTLFAVNPDSGESKWTKGDLIGGSDDTALILDKDGNIYLGTTSGYIYIISSEGVIKNTITIENANFNGWTMTLDNNNHLFVNDTNNTKTYIINLTNNDVTTLNLDYAGYNNPILIGNYLYVFGLSYIYKVNITNSNVDVSYNIGSNVGSDTCSPVVDNDGYIYIGTKSKGFLKLDQNLNKIWTYPNNTSDFSNYYFNGTSPILGSDNQLYLVNASGNGQLLCLNLDGTLKWAKNDSSLSGSYSTPAIGLDKTIYIATSSGVKAYK